MSFAYYLILIQFHKSETGYSFLEFQTAIKTTSCQHFGYYNMMIDPYHSSAWQFCAHNDIDKCPICVTMVLWANATKATTKIRVKVLDKSNTKNTNHSFFVGILDVWMKTLLVFYIHSRIHSSFLSHGIAYSDGIHYIMVSNISANCLWCVFLGPFTFVHRLMWWY